MLCDMLTRNGIGAPEEHLNLRYLGEGGDWRPAGVLAEARRSSPGEFFGSKVMIHWLDELKKHGDMPSATDMGILAELFGEEFTMIHLYRADSVAAAVSFTMARLGHQWHQKAGHAAKPVELPEWEVLDMLISENVAWLDWCKHRLRRAASTCPWPVVEMRYEELERDPVTELGRVVAAILGEEAAAADDLKVSTELVKQRGARSAELRRRWLDEHPAYESYDPG